MVFSARWNTKKLYRSVSNLSNYCIALLRDFLLVFKLLGLVSGPCKCFMPWCPVRYCIVYCTCFWCCSEQIKITLKSHTVRPTLSNVYWMSPLSLKGLFQLFNVQLLQNTFAHDNDMTKFIGNFLTNTAGSSMMVWDNMPYLASKQQSLMSKNINLRRTQNILTGRKGHVTTYRPTLCPKKRPLFSNNSVKN